MALDRSQRYQDQVVAVTGGGSGLGEAMVLAFAAEGGAVAVLDVDTEAAARVAKTAGDRCRAYTCDVTDLDAVTASLGAVSAELGPVDVLVNNAGIAARRDDVEERGLANLAVLTSGQGELQPLRALSSLDPAAFDRMIRTHLYGTFHCSKVVLAEMEERRTGVILNIASIAGVIGLSGAPDYSAAKGAIISLTKAMAQDVVHAGIRVNAIAPGWIATPMTENAMSEQSRALIPLQVPMARWGRPEEVAALALHLCSDEASYTTGQVISPNGGLV